MLQNYLSSIIESMPSMLISVDSEHRIVNWNAAATEITGIKHKKALGEHIWTILPVSSDYKNTFDEVIEHKKRASFRKKKIMPNLDKYFDIIFFPLVSEESEGVVLKIDDVTELEKKDQQLIQIQKMETVGNLAGGLAHDFNNVLGGITGSLSILKFKKSSGKKIKEEELEKYLDTMEESSKRATDMVQQLLTLSRKSELSFTLVDLNNIMKNVLRICENTFDKSVEIRPIFSKTPAIINADTNQLEQIVLNLCVNAYHSMTIMRKPDEKQGGVITISIEQIFADKHFSSTHPEAEERNYSILSVKDSGVGITQKTLSKIFEPFFTTKQKGKGTGLGLSMVYSIVSQHKGFIDVYSEIGYGTTFNIYLPLMEKKNGRDVKKKVPVEFKKGEGLILVVDDEPVMRDMSRAILKECGYDVITVENGEIGVEIFKERHQEIKAVILDMVMPKMGGKQTFIEMKKIQFDVVVLLASGFRKDERIDEILSMGVKGFLQKPFTINKLSTIIYNITH